MREGGDVQRTGGSGLWLYSHQHSSRGSVCRLQLRLDDRLMVSRSRSPKTALRRRYNESLSRDPAGSRALEASASETRCRNCSIRRCDLNAISLAADTTESGTVVRDQSCSCTPVGRPQPTLTLRLPSVLLQRSGLDPAYLWATMLQASHVFTHSECSSGSRFNGTFAKSCALHAR